MDGCYTFSVPLVNRLWRGRYMEYPQIVSTDVDDLTCKKPGEAFARAIQQ
jgi:hypothetical protein